MKILAVECSTVLGSVAVSQSSEVLASLSWKRKKSHGKLLITSLSQALGLAGLNFKDIYLLAVGNGPGSFTGLRVALSVIKTLSYSLDLPVAVFNSLRILAENHQNQDFNDQKTRSIYTIQNAFAQKFFFAEYQKTNRKCIEVQSPKILSQDEVMRMLKKPGRVLGCIHDLLPQEFLLSHHLDISHKNSLMHYPHADHLAVLSSQEPLTTNTWENISAFYLKPSSAEEKMKHCLLKP